jgi:hypothetical protein
LLWVGGSDGNDLARLDRQGPSWEIYSLDLPPLGTHVARQGGAVGGAVGSGGESDAGGLMRWRFNAACDACHHLTIFELVTARRFCREFNERFARQIFEEMLKYQILAADLNGAPKRQFAGLRGVGCLPRTR